MSCPDRNLTQLLQDVIHPGHRQIGMQQLLPLAMGIQLFPEFANALLLRFGGIGEVI